MWSTRYVRERILVAFKVGFLRLLQSWDQKGEAMLIQSFTSGLLFLLVEAKPLDLSSRVRAGAIRRQNSEAPSPGEGELSPSAKESAITPIISTIAGIMSQRAQEAKDVCGAPDHGQPRTKETWNKYMMNEYFSTT